MTKKKDVTRKAGATITEKALIVQLRVSMWSGQKIDKKIGAEVAELHSVKVEPGRYNKFLVHPDFLKEFRAIKEEVRKYHTLNTLPWEDGGYRLLPSANYFQYLEVLTEIQGRAEAVADKVAAQFEGAKREWASQLNGLYDENDYPSTSDIRGKFGVRIEFSPVPDKGDFRVDLSKKELARIQASTEQAVSERLAEALKDPYRRIAEALTHLIATVKKEKPVIRESLVGNLVDLVTLIPKLNIFDDPDLEAVRKQVEEKLTKIDRDTLADDPKTRNQVAKDAEAILKKLKGVI